LTIREPTVDAAEIALGFIAQTLEAILLISEAVTVAATAEFMNLTASDPTVFAAEMLLESIFQTSTATSLIASEVRITPSSRVLTTNEPILLAAEQLLVSSAHTALAIFEALTSKLTVDFVKPPSA
jgi:hypothetical protein